MIIPKAMDDIAKDVSIQKKLKLLISAGVFLAILGITLGQINVAAG